MAMAARRSDTAVVISLPPREVRTSTSTSAAAGPSVGRRTEVDDTGDFGHAAHGALGSSDGGVVGRGERSPVLGRSHEGRLRARVGLERRGEDVGPGARGARRQELGVGAALDARNRGEEGCCHHGEGHPSEDDGETVADAEPSEGGEQRGCPPGVSWPPCRGLASSPARRTAAPSSQLNLTFEVR